MPTVLIDGKERPAEDVDASKHKFIGMFRHPRPPGYSTKPVGPCTCGEELTIQGQEREHWARGCYDIPQYVSLETSTSDAIFNEFDTIFDEAQAVFARADKTFTRFFGRSLRKGKRS